MNLRQQLLARAKVACCVHQQTQPATFQESSATTTATTAQQIPANPHEIRVSSATSTATNPQQGPKSTATLPPKNVPQKLRQLRISCAPAADPYDDRVTCQTCRNLWPGNHCLTHRKAGLDTRDLAQEFTTLMQRCPAYAPLARPETAQ